VECNKIVDPDEVCDSSCKVLKETAYTTPAGDIVVVDSTGTLTTFDLTEFDEKVFGKFECKLTSEKCAMNSVGKTSEGRFTYDFGISPKVLAHAWWRMLAELDEEEWKYEEFYQNGTLIWNSERWWMLEQLLSDEHWML